MLLWLEKITILLNLRSISFIGNMSLFFIKQYLFYVMMAVSKEPSHRLLIIFANSLDPDQDGRNIGPDLDRNGSTF